MLIKLIHACLAWIMLCLLDYVIRVLEGFIKIILTILLVYYNLVV